MKNSDNIKFMKDENKLVLDKFLFMREMYQEALRDKRQYKNRFLEVGTALVRFLISQESWMLSCHRNCFLKRCM